MSEPEINIDEKPLVLPRVLVLVGDNKKTINTNYEFCTIHYESDYDYSNTPEFFNSFLPQAGSYNMFLFMNKNTNFLEKHSLETWVKTLFFHSIYGGSYTDLAMLNKEGKTVNYHINPSYNAKKIISNNRVINSPLLIKTQVLDSFDKSLSILYMWDFLIRLCKKTLIYHVARPILTRLNNEEDNLDITKEYQVINEKIQKT